MDKKHQYNVLVFLYYYIIMMYVAVYYSCASGGPKKGFLMLGIGIVLGTIWIAYKWKHKSAKEEEQKNEKRCHGIVLAAAIVFTIAMEVAFPQNDWYVEKNGVASWTLWFVLLLLAFLEKKYTEYFYQKYLLLYANQNASQSMIRRFEQNVRKSLKRKILAFGIFLAVMFTIGISLQQLPVNEVQVEQTKKTAKPSSKKSKVKQPKTKKPVVPEKKEENRFKELLLKFILKLVSVLFVLLFVIGLIFVIFVILKKMMHLSFPKYEKIEKQEVQEAFGDDEFVALRPQKSESVTWGKDNNSRVRKFFVKKVKKKSHGKVNKTLSAREMALEYEIEEPELISTYEIARYSGRQCTDEETAAILGK